MLPRLRLAHATSRALCVTACVVLAPLPVAASDVLDITTLAGSAGSSGSADGTGSAARFYGPAGVAVDGAGNVYVADTLNCTIRKVTPAGEVSTLAGRAGMPGSTNGLTFMSLFFGPAGVAVDANGTLYVADSVNCTIRKISGVMVSTLAGSPLSAGSVDGTGSAARFNGPGGLAVDSAGNIYVADTGNHTIRKVTPSGEVTTLAGMAGTAGSADGTGTAAQFNGPAGVAVDASGNILVADSANHTIRKITPAGEVTTLAGSAGNSGSADGTGGAARFNSPAGVAVDASGNVCVGDTANSILRKITPAGMVVTAAGTAGATGNVDATGSAARFSRLSGVAVSADGSVFVADTQNYTIRKGVPSSAAVATPVFNPEPGSYGGAQSVSLSCATAGAEIHYTTDGTTPTAASALYSGPLAISTTMTIKALAVLAGLPDSAVASGIYTIGVNQAPAANAQTINAVQGTSVTITLTGSDPEGAALSFALTGTPAHGTLNNFNSSTGALTYTAAADYAGADSFTFTASDGTSTSAPATVSITVQASGGGAGSNSNVDSDGDGFPDEIEIAANTSPADPNSTPFGGAPAGAPLPLAVSKLMIKLSFVPDAAGKDSLSLSGTLPVPAQFVVAGQQVVVDVGGVAKSFALDAKGKSPKGQTESFKLAVKAKKKMVYAQDAKFTAKFKKGTFASTLADEDLTNADAKNAKVSVPVIILFNGATYRKDQAQLYTAKKDKSGRTKMPR